MENHGGDSFSLYLEARAEWNRRTPSSIRKAIRYLDRAISLNGGFALASAALADCYSILMDYGVLSPREGLTQARLASGRALHRGPNLAEALTSAALVRQMDLDWIGADAEFKAAIQAHPGYAVARQRYALFLAWMGRRREARGEIAVAGALDPHSPAVAASAAWVDYYGGRFLEAAQAAEATLDRHPGFSSAEAVLALSLIRLHHPGRAADLLEDALTGEEENVSLLSLLSYARGRAGEPESAKSHLERLRDWADTRFVSPYYLAVPHLGIDDEEGAMTALREAEKSRCTQLVYLASDPIFFPLRNRSDFQALLKRLHLPVQAVGEEIGVREEVA